jgi:hypothetical protein
MILPDRTDNDSDRTDNDPDRTDNDLIGPTMILIGPTMDNEPDQTDHDRRPAHTASSLLVVNRQDCPGAAMPRMDELGRQEASWT